jgi:uncharacterized membrane protein YraQ (UPF0718 family)
MVEFVSPSCICCIPPAAGAFGMAGGPPTGAALFLRDKLIPPHHSPLTFAARPYKVGATCRHLMV